VSSQTDICNRALNVIGTRSSIASMTEDSPEAQACSLHFIPACRAMLRVAPWSFARKTVQGALLAAAPGTPENPNGTAPLPLVPISPANPAGSTPTQIVMWQYEYAWPQDCVRLRQVKEPVNQPNQGTNVVPLWPGVNMSDPLLAAAIGDLGQRVNYQLAVDSDAAGNDIRVILTNVEYALIVYTKLITDPNMWDDEFSEAFVFMLGSHLVGALIGEKQMDKAMYEKASQMALVARAVDANEQPVSPNHTPDWIRVRNGIWSRPDDGPEPWDMWEYGGMP
jgi:hypothetical protein